MAATVTINTIPNPINFNPPGTVQQAISGTSLNAQTMGKQVDAGPIGVITPANTWNSTLTMSDLPFPHTNYQLSVHAWDNNGNVTIATANVSRGT